MQINETVKGEIKIKNIQQYPSTMAKMMTVRLSARMDRDTAKKTFGDAFARLVLPELGKEARDETGSYHHAYSTIKPTGTFESHKVIFPEPVAKEVNAIPELAGVSAVDNEEAVDVEIDVPIQVEDNLASFIGKIAIRVGSTMVVQFEPRQLSLPLDEARKQAEGQKVIRIPGPHGASVPKVVG
jgi:hypothetical protein